MLWSRPASGSTPPGAKGGLMKVCWKHGVAFALAIGLVSSVSGQEAVPLDFSRSQWIGVAGSTPEVLAFRWTMDLAGGASYARLLVTADAAYDLFVNGVSVGSDADMASPEHYDVAHLLKPGRNVLAVKVTSSGAHPALLVAGRVIDGQGRLFELASDASWRAAPAPKGTWTEPGYNDSAWPAAAALGTYGALPWGRLTRMSVAESRRAMREVRLEIPAEERPLSEFKGDLPDPALAKRYEEFLGVDRRTGRFRRGDQSLALLFVRYQQPGEADTPAEFDFDRFEHDLDLLAANGLQVALGGFGWQDLLNADGTWRKVTTQPKGEALPTFEYTYEIVGYALDRIQVHGLVALALLDLRQPLPAGLLPAGYRDKFLVAPSLWQSVLAGQAKIVKEFSRRSVLAGYATATDALPAWPAADDPLTREAFGAYLRDKHGDLATLQRNWGLPTQPTDFNAVPLPKAQPNDPSTIDFHAWRDETTAARLSEWADVLRAASPQQLYLVGLADTQCPLFSAGRLRVDLLGAFALTGGQPSAGRPMPGYGDTVALVNAYRRMNGSSVAGVLGGRWGAEQKGGQAARTLRHEWAAVLEGGGAGLLAAPPYTALVDEGDPSAQDTVGLRELGELLKVTAEPYRAQAPQVLVVRNAATALSNLPEPDECAAARLGEALDRLGIAYDVVSAECVGGPGERYRVNVDDYRAVIVPSLVQLPSDRFFDRLKSWVEAPTKNGRRLLVLGRWSTRNEYFQPVAESASLRALAGRGALPTVGRQEIAGNAVVSTDLSFTGSAGDDDALVEKAVVWLSNSFQVVGLRPAWSTPPNVTVCFSDDGRRAIVRERLGSSADTAWVQPVGQPPLAWTGGTTTLDGKGTQQFNVSLAPYQVRVVDAVADIMGVGPNDTASVRIGRRGDLPLAFNASGPQGMTLKVHLKPQQTYWVATAGRDAMQTETGADGTLELPAGPFTTVQVAAVPVAQPDPAGRPDDFMAVGDYYVRRGEYLKALREFQRLEQDYAGTNVSALAAKRRAAILGECGAVVVANLSKAPLGVRFVGPTSTDAVVPSGRNQTFILYAGQYQFHRLPPPGITLPAALAQQPLPVVKGTVTVVDYLATVPGKPTEVDVKANLRGPLSDDEKTALAGQGKSELVVAAPAAAPPAGGAGTAPGEAGGTPAAAEKPKGPDKVIKVATTTRNPSKPGATKIVVRNLTREVLEITYTRFVAGVAPEHHTVTVKPHGRAEIAMEGSGTYDVNGKVLSNDQEFVIGQLRNNGSEYECQVKEYTPEQWARIQKKMDQEKASRAKR